METQNAVDGLRLDEAIELRHGQREPGGNIRMLMIDDCGIHDAVRIGVWKGMQQRAVDDVEHGAGGSDAQGQGENGNDRDMRVPTQGAEPIANVSADLVKGAKSDRGTIFFLLHVRPAELDLRLPECLLRGEARISEVLRVGVDVKLQLLLDLVISSRAMHESVPPEADRGEETHASSGVAPRMESTTSVIRAHFSVSALSCFLPDAVRV
jgi:hypothetical protein